MSSKWQQTTTALKNKAGAIEGAIDKRVSTAQEKLSEFIYEEEEGAHRVSDYKWRRAMFQFRGTLHHGIPAGPTCIAFDPVQRLMAVGTDKGLVKLFGKPGVEVVVNQYAGSITHLCFLVNMGKLVLVHRGGSCEGVNLDSRRSIGSYVFKGAVVTCLVHVPNTDFVCVGLDTGHVHVLSAAGKLALSSYRISGRSALGSKPSAVAGKIRFRCSSVRVIADQWEEIRYFIPPLSSRPYADRPRMRDHQRVGSQQRNLSFDLSPLSVACHCLGLSHYYLLASSRRSIRHRLSKRRPPGVETRTIISPSCHLCYERASQYT